VPFLYPKDGENLDPDEHRTGDRQVAGERLDRLAASEGHRAGQLHDRAVGGQFTDHVRDQLGRVGVRQRLDKGGAHSRLSVDQRLDDAELTGIERTGGGGDVFILHDGDLQM